MIKEKVLDKRSAVYARGVVGCLAQASGPRTVLWAEVEKLIQAAHYNGFQSGVVWQKKSREDEDERPFSIEIEPIDLGRGRISNMQKAVTEDGHFIGSPKDATALWKKFGITQFELRTSRSKVCSVGYSPTKAQWFGWSHRAIRGFKTRKEAARFAESVS